MQRPVELSGCDEPQISSLTKDRSLSSLENCVSLTGMSIRLWTDDNSGPESGKQFTVFLYGGLQPLQQRVFRQAVLVRTVWSVHHSILVPALWTLLHRQLFRCPQTF